MGSENRNNAFSSNDLRLLDKISPQAKELSGGEKSIWNSSLQDVTIVNNSTQ